MNANKKAFCQQWEESEKELWTHTDGTLEPGVTVRPDGYSLHLSIVTAGEYISNRLKEQSRYFKNKGVEGTPDSYSRPSGAIYEVYVSDEVYKRLQEEKNIQVDNNDYPKPTENSPFGGTNLGEIFQKEPISNLLDAIEAVPFETNPSNWAISFDCKVVDGKRKHIYVEHRAIQAVMEASGTSPITTQESLTAIAANIMDEKYQDAFRHLGGVVFHILANEKNPKIPPNQALGITYKGDVEIRIGNFGDNIFVFLPRDEFEEVYDEA